MNRMMRWFSYAHLPAGEPRNVSQKVCELAQHVDATIPESAEKTAGLRKLLEAKDCFVRAQIERVGAEREGASAL